MLHMYICDPTTHLIVTIVFNHTSMKLIKCLKVKSCFNYLKVKMLNNMTGFALSKISGHSIWSSWFEHHLYCRCCRMGEKRCVIISM